VKQFVELVLGLPSAVPAILEGRDLDLALVVLRRFAEQVVVALRVEWRVEVGEIDDRRGDGLTQDVQSIAVVNLDHRHRPRFGVAEVR